MCEGDTGYSALSSLSAGGLWAYTDSLGVFGSIYSTQTCALLGEGSAGENVHGFCSTSDHRLQPRSPHHQWEDACVEGHGQTERPSPTFPSLRLLALWIVTAGLIISPAHPAGTRIAFLHLRGWILCLPDLDWNLSMEAMITVSCYLVLVLFS